MKNILVTVPAEVPYLDLMQTMKLGLEMTYHAQDGGPAKVMHEKAFSFLLT